MICTVSTVKDSPENVSRFVTRNLAAGVDHMFVFLDEHDAAVEALLDDEPHVTAVITDEAYWRGDRPPNLNVRQVVNANLANCLLAPFDWCTWLFHIDGDECLHADKQWLLDAPPSVRSVRLSPLEAVSRAEPAGEVTQFKRMLDLPELSVLYALGIIEERRNHEYFHGHIRGKSGIRPALDVKLGVHSAHGPDETKLEQAEGPHLQHLHFESYSSEEFVRKWMAHSGPSRASGRKRMLAVRAAVHAVSTNPALSDDRRRHYLREIYSRWIEDPADVLDELGYLVEVHPEDRSAVPRPLDPARHSELEELLGRLVALPKAGFTPERRGPAMIRTVRRVLEAKDLTPQLRRRLESLHSPSAS